MNKFFFGIAILMGLIGCSETENKLEVFVSGAEIAGVNGIIFGPDGYLYATSVIGSDISVVDTENKKIVKIEIDPSKRLADVNSADNSISFE